MARCRPPSILTVVQDTTTSIRNSVNDVEITLVLSTILVVLVVFLFLRNLRATLVPAVSVPLALLGTFGMMYLLGFIARQFLADGADHFDRLRGRQHHRGAGKRHPPYGEWARRRLEAALHGAREVAFTVLSMSMSLVAVFLPILLMGGIVGRLFHEFAMTLTSAIVDLADRFADASRR